MSLQKAIEAPEVARLRFVSEAPDSHQLDMVAHQIAQCAAERWGLSKRLERLIGIGSKQGSQYRFAALHVVFVAKISDRITGDRALLNQEVQEAIYDTGSVERRGCRPILGTFT